MEELGRFDFKLYGKLLNSLSGPHLAFANYLEGPLENFFKICIMKNKNKRKVFSSKRIFESSLHVKRVPERG